MNGFEISVMIPFAFVAYFSCFLAKKDMALFNVANLSYSKSFKAKYFARRAATYFVEHSVAPALYFAIVYIFS